MQDSNFWYRLQLVLLLMPIDPVPIGSVHIYPMMDTLQEC